LLYGLGSLALERADTVQAISLLTASLTLRQEIGDTEGIAWSLSTLALVNVGQDAAHADALFTESIGLFKTLHDTHSIAQTPCCRSSAPTTGHYPRRSLFAKVSSIIGSSVMELRSNSCKIASMADPRTTREHDRLRLAISRWGAALKMIDVFLGCTSLGRANLLRIVNSLAAQFQ
jgi:hypothetical protein